MGARGALVRRLGGEVQFGLGALKEIVLLG
jgi:hypothetical protein